jgi:hypothetical protein
MGHDLVPMKVEIDPIITGPTLRTAENRAIEFPRFSEIVDRKSQMKWWSFGHGRQQRVIFSSFWPWL